MSVRKTLICVCGMIIPFNEFQKHQITAIHKKGVVKKIDDMVEEANEYFCEGKDTANREKWEEINEFTKKWGSGDIVYPVFDMDDI